MGAFGLLLSTLIYWPCLVLNEMIEIFIGLLVIIPLGYSIVTKGTKKTFRYVNLFRICSSVPCGVQVMKLVTKLTTPYTDSIGAVIKDIQYSTDQVSCVIEMEHHYWLENPFNSIHAVALSNLGEYSSGIIAMSWFQENEKHKIRGIVTTLKACFYKKARGKITAKTVLKLSDELTSKAENEIVINTRMFDSQDEMVAETFVTWSISIKQS